MTCKLICDVFEAAGSPEAPYDPADDLHDPLWREFYMDGADGERFLAEMDAWTAEPAGAR